MESVDEVLTKLSETNPYVAKYRRRLSSLSVRNQSALTIIEVNEKGYDDPEGSTKEIGHRD